MSILDAFTLSQSFSSLFSLPPSCHSLLKGELIATALHSYERERLPATTAQMIFARFLGKLKNGMIAPYSFSPSSPYEERRRLGQAYYVEFCRNYLSRSAAL
mmetsp:Transcript_14442/g.22537  ORF Transcript_14442/g.22537 Transcript_14442/m.22537 type:complete len:102 (-) Transcript_14442:2345-2650(-)